MLVFEFTSWALCLATTAALIFALVRAPYVYVKPSVIVILFFHIFIQWAATTDAEEIYAWLPEPWDFALLTHGVPLLTLAATQFIARPTAKATLARLGKPIDESWAPGTERVVLLLFGTVVTIILIYLRFVPIRETGLFAIFEDPENAAQARENSLKLLASQPLKYAVAIMSATVSPVLAVLAATWTIVALRRGPPGAVLVPLAIVVITLVAVSITGARASASTVLFTLITAAFLKRQLRVNYFAASAAGLALLAPPTILSILREGRRVSFENFWLYLRNQIFGRVFFGPMETGLWHVHYAQTLGFFGIGGIEKLAPLFGARPVNVPNVIGLTYVASTLDSVNANTSFIYSYYSYFGMPSYVLSIALILALDCALFVYPFLSENVLAAAVPALLTACLAFVFADYNTALGTHGFVPILLLALILERVLRTRGATQLRRGVA